MPLHSTFKLFSIAFGLLSAAAWFYSSRVKVTKEQEAARRAKKGERGGFVVLDGQELGATLRAQSKWNAIGSSLAAAAVVLGVAADALSP